MATLSISQAWEETRAILARDGRLYVSVALALIALPSAVNLLVSPGGVNATVAPVWVDLIALAASLIGLAGQLALIRLALGPSITVGAAVAHGLRRMPFYFLAVLLLICALFVIGIPFGVILAVSGVSITHGNVLQVSNSPVALLLGLLYLAIAVFIGVRMVLSAPIASGESAGPISILRRSWALTAGHWWSLFAFLIIYAVIVVIVMMAVRSVVGIGVRLTLGPAEPLSSAALVLALVQSVVSAAITGLFAMMLARIYVQLAGRSDAERMGEVFR